MAAVGEEAPPPAESRGLFFYLRQSIGLVFAFAGVAITVLGFDQYYYGLDNLAVTWIGLLVAVIGLICHETRPYKRWDDWMLLKGYLNLDKYRQQEAQAEDSKKKK